MLAVFYWGSLIFTILFVGVALYGVYSLIKNWKQVDAQKRLQFIPKILGMAIPAVICFIIFMTLGLFYEPKNKDEKVPPVSQDQGIRLIVTNTYTAENQDPVAKYIGMFVSQTNVGKSLSEVESIKATLMNTTKYDYTYDDYGWTKQIYIEVKLKNKTNLPRDWMADGQTLHYIIGAGNTPGAVAKKAVSQHFAGMPIDNSADTFVSIPALAGMDDIGK